MNKIEGLKTGIQQNALEVNKKAESEYKGQLKIKEKLKKELEKNYDILNKVDLGNEELKALKEKDIDNLKDVIKELEKNIAMTNEIIAFYKFNFGFE